MEDVTESMVTEHQYSSTKPQEFRNLQPVKKLTSSQERTLQACHGLHLAYISKPLFYDKALRLFNKRDHKTLLNLLYGGWVKVYRVPGDLPGDQPPSHVGAREGRHFLLVDSRQQPITDENM